jgi:transposase
LNYALRLLLMEFSKLTRLRAVRLSSSAWHRDSPESSRLTTIPGVGPLTATAIIATVGEAGKFRSSRHFAAWIGLVPRQHSSGGKPVLGRISKRGSAYL